jgi:hypothetical protein
VADNLEESENIASISNLCRGKGLYCDAKDFVQSDDHLTTHYKLRTCYSSNSSKKYTKRRCGGRGRRRSSSQRTGYFNENLYTRTGPSLHQ